MIILATRASSGRLKSEIMEDPDDDVPLFPLGSKPKAPAIRHLKAKR